MNKPSPRAMLEMEHERAYARRKLLGRVEQSLRDTRSAINLDEAKPGRPAPGLRELVSAVRDLADVVKLVSDAEDRIMQLHAECFAMVEQSRKVLELDAMRRPTIIQIEGPVDLSAVGKKEEPR